MVTDHLLIEKAGYFGKRLKVENFSYTTGWLAGFKKRFNISMKALCGEAESADAVTIAVGRDDVQSILKDYAKYNIHNCDKTALFLCTPPGKTLNQGPARGTPVRMGR
ncbi:MAG: DNA-binding domain-containing protein, partial [Leptolyngbya sp. Prado105]|nr:DNA-binding domain-containing protein [Leptolyngbya sp. Prado105]